ncbi:hypothetical protein CCUS01_09044 [Colletotrichum cuscutae]|uniref:Uncharacterized protein n=1 Tax=Colletotrichum cuscutae TaxID=1209917 RepID=A0AAI9UKI2_9PEZI|nr:hypothetical protein CCUS01_09044 [Colletotrichum cuscutae]
MWMIARGVGLWDKAIAGREKVVGRAVIREQANGLEGQIFAVSYGTRSRKRDPLSKALVLVVGAGSGICSKSGKSSKLGDPSWGLLALALTRRQRGGRADVRRTTSASGRLTISYGMLGTLLEQHPSAPARRPRRAGRASLWSLSNSAHPSTDHSCPLPAAGMVRQFAQGGCDWSPGNYQLLHTHCEITPRIIYGRRATKMSPEKRKYDMFSEIELKLRNHQVTMTIFQGNIITHRVHLTRNILISKHASRDCTPTLLMALTVFEHHFAANGLIIDGGEHQLIMHNLTITAQGCSLLIYCRPGFELRFGLRAKFSESSDIFRLHGITELAPNSSFARRHHPLARALNMLCTSNISGLRVRLRNQLLWPAARGRLTGYTTNLNHFEAFPNRNGQASHSHQESGGTRQKITVTQFPSGGFNQGSCYIACLHRLDSSYENEELQSIPGGEKAMRSLESWKFGVPFPVAFELQSIFVVLSDARYTIQTGVLASGPRTRKSLRYPSPEICLMGIWSPRPDVISDLRHYLASSDEYDESNDENRGPCCTSDERFGSLPGRLSPNPLSTTQDSQSHQAIPARKATDNRKFKKIRLGKRRRCIEYIDVSPCKMYRGLPPAEHLPKSR